MSLFEENRSLKWYIGEVYEPFEENLSLKWYIESGYMPPKKLFSMVNQQMW